MSADEELVASVVAKRLRLRPGELEVDTDLFAAGLDSLQAIAIAEELEQRTGIAVEDEIAFEHPSVRLLAARLATLRD